MKLNNCLNCKLKKEETPEKEQRLIIRKFQQGKKKLVMILKFHNLIQKDLKESKINLIFFEKGV